MTQEDKELLLKDLGARLSYGPIVSVTDGTIKYNAYIESISYKNIQVSPVSDSNFTAYTFYKISEIKPYLRPMSSMTEKEFINLTTVTELQYDQLELVEWDNNCKTLEFYLSEVPHYCVIKVFDWLNAHHFDYRGLIEKGLAIAVTKENNPYKS